MSMSTCLTTVNNPQNYLGAIFHLDMSSGTERGRRNYSTANVMTWLKMQFNNSQPNAIHDKMPFVPGTHHGLHGWDMSLDENAACVFIGKILKPC